MDDNARTALTEITVRIPADLARRLGVGGEIERRIIEALALDEFRQGYLSRTELRQLLGFVTRAKLDEFLTGHGVFGTYTADDLERDREDQAAVVPDEESRARARQAAANIIARRKGVTLGGLSIKDLINEGRP
ncbi:MAG: UPF0175 family protein [Alphaproteobacteria bacterium]|nr:UPF0175 family protein [Alphaproteobacteria bacterium]